MLDDIWEFIVYAFFVVVLPFLVIFGIALGGANMHGYYTCTQYERITGVQTEWVPFDTCYVSYQDTMVRYEDYVTRHLAHSISPIGTNR